MHKSYYTTYILFVEQRKAEKAAKRQADLAVWDSVPNPDFSQCWSTTKTTPPPTPTSALDAASASDQQHQQDTACGVPAGDGGWLLLIIVVVVVTHITHLCVNYIFVSFDLGKSYRCGDTKQQMASFMRRPPHNTAAGFTRAQPSTSSTSTTRREYHGSR